MKELRRKNVRGLIVHKIDRSARNLKDWADLGELIDAGLEVHFANESLDLNTRGGRLSADIQAVVAADYIRNLREESRKGFYGRLKQGLYPLPAPIGYVDRGKGKEKELDPERAPLVARLFETYGTGKYSLHRLLEEARMWGLRNRRGAPLTLNGLSTVLNNPFYTGLIRIYRTREVFTGNHQPIVAKSLFDRVQAILRGKTVVRTVHHNFAFRKAVHCGNCGYTLIGERQKGHIYYRCQRRSCPVTAAREEKIDAAISPLVAKLILDPEEMAYVRAWMEEAEANEHTGIQQLIHSSRLQLDGIRARLGRLTDALIDGSLEKPLFDARKTTLLNDEQRVLEKIRDLETGNETSLQRLERFLELVKNAPVAYENAEPDEKRDLVKNLFSNLQLIDKNVAVALKPAVKLIANRQKTRNSRPSQGVHRTWEPLLETLLSQFEREPI